MRATQRFARLKGGGVLTTPGLRITWVGHSTVLIELDGVRLLTDPMLRHRVSFLMRVAGDADVAALADLDAVLISHLHYDHLDIASLGRVGREVPVVVPAGKAGRLLRGRGFSRIVPVAVGDETSVGPVTVRATPAEHDGSRGPLLARGPAVGYLVSGSARVYFAGDTDLFGDMRALAPIDVALLPVAGWGPRLPPGHLSPRAAAEALQLLQPLVAVPIHWGTYRRIGIRADSEVLQAPADEFVRHARELAPEVDVRVVPVGGTLELSLPSRETVSP